MRRLLGCFAGVLVLIAGLAAGHAAAPSKEIWFQAPRNFATGAVPPATAFNAAFGDQLALQISHAALSDGLAVGDFDRDGKTDVAQTNVLAGTVSIFRGDGKAGFAAATLYPVGALPNFITTGDFDRDGDLDLAVANVGSGSISILLGDGAGRFLPAPAIPVPAPRNVAIGDFNGDDVPDLAVASGSPSCPRNQPNCFNRLSQAGGVVLLAGSGHGGAFTVEQLVTPARSDSGQPIGPNYVAVGDFDRSGFDDLAVAVGTSANAGDRPPGSTQPTGDDVLIYLNRNGSGAEPFGQTPSQPPLRVGATPDAIAVGDWNGDRHPDLAVLANMSSEVTSIVGGKHGRFAIKARNITVGGLPRTLHVADFNGDGVNDLVTTGFASSTVSVLQGRKTARGKGDGSFLPAAEFWVGDAPTAVAAGRFDADRKIDIVVARLRTDQLSLLVNGSPRAGDGVVVTRDIPFVRTSGDPYAAHHTLDVYVPPRNAPSFAGKGRPYPVFFFVHGGGGITGDKSMVGYVLRSLARKGIVGVAANYRLGVDAEGNIDDVAAAFRWTRASIGSRAFGGDPRTIFVAGHSMGGHLVAQVGLAPAYAAHRQHIRGLILVSTPNQYTDRSLEGTPPGTIANQPPSLLINGTDGAFELAGAFDSAVFAELSRRGGAVSSHVIVPGRDHLTIQSNLARSDDPGHKAILDFMRATMSAR